MRRLYMFLLLVLLLTPFFRVASAEEPVFSLSIDHPFRILIIADPQDIDTPQPAMLSLLNASLDAFQPDLVVFLEL